MKRKLLVLSILLLSIGVNAFGQNQTKEDILIDAYGKLRADMVRQAAEQVKYLDDIEKITNKTIIPYYNALSAASAKNEKANTLKLIIGDANHSNCSFSGSDVDKYNQKITDFYKNLAQAYKTHLHEFNMDHALEDWPNEISRLTDECKKFEEGEKYQNYQPYIEKYGRNGLFYGIAIKAMASTSTTETSKEETIAANEESDLGDVDGTSADTTSTPEGSIEASQNPTHEKRGEEPEKKKTNVKDETKEDSHFLLYLTIALALLLVGGIGVYMVARKKKSQSKNPSQVQSAPAPKTDPNPVPTPTPQPVPNPKQAPNQDPTPMPIPTPLMCKAEWVVTGASVKGNGHVQSNMPCQDNHKFESLGDGWGIAIVSDGAGSAEHSELGSKVVAERGVIHFKNLIEKEGWMKNKELPSDVEWMQKSYYVLKNMRDEVEMVAKKNNIDIKTLSATCLAVIYSPMGLLTVHVGDGRMGFKNANDEWKAIMTPHKGDEANQTIFLVSDFWTIPNYVMSGVLVPESIVVREPVKAFALMSDGCENTAWKCTIANPETGKYYDQNKPFEGFFNPLEKQIRAFHAEKVSESERQARWYKFIESGTDGFVKEQDDKTMIFGVNMNL